MIPYSEYKQKLNVFSYVIVFFGVIQIIYYLFFYQFGFNYEVTYNRHYFLLFITGACLIGYFITIFYLKYIHKWQILHSTFLVILLYYAYKNIEQEYLVVFIVAVITFLLLLELNIRCVVILPFFLNIFFLYENYLACTQALSGMPIVGSLKNSGILAIYFTIHLPVIFLCIKLCIGQMQNAGKKRAFLFSCLLTLLILVTLSSLYFIILVQSRTALISLAIIFVTIIYQSLYELRKKRTVIKKYINLIPFLFTVVIIAITWYSLSIKRMSVMGRFLMDKIALAHISDCFWFGTGIGHFTWYYPQWQAEFIQRTPNLKPCFLNNAGESYIIFNEYLQLIEAVGVFGFFFFVLILVYFFRTISTRNKAILQIVKLTIIAILATGFTSYPFHVNFILLLMVLCLAIGFKINEKESLLSRQRHILEKSDNYLIAGISVILIVTIFITKKISEQSRAIDQWQDLKEHYTSELQERKKYKRIYPLLEKDGKFLLDYGEYLMQDSSESENAINVLNIAKQKFISKEGIESLGIAYWNKKDYKNAIKCYKWTNNFLPGLFEPKLCLLKLYMASGNNIEAEKIGNLIIQTPPKIPSAEINDIKSQAQDILNNITRN